MNDTLYSLRSLLSFFLSFSPPLSLRTQYRFLYLHIVQKEEEGKMMYAAWVKQESRGGRSLLNKNPTRLGLQSIRYAAKHGWANKAICENLLYVEGHQCTSHCDKHDVCFWFIPPFTVSTVYPPNMLGCTTKDPSTGRVVTRPVYLPDNLRDDAMEQILEDPSKNLDDIQKQQETDNFIFKDVLGERHKQAVQEGYNAARERLERQDEPQPQLTACPYLTQPLSPGTGRITPHGFLFLGNLGSTSRDDDEVAHQTQTLSSGTGIITPDGFVFLGNVGSNSSDDDEVAFDAD